MSSNRNKVLFVLLDAFRHDYVNAVDTPFLWAGTQRGVYARKLKTTTGFTQRSAIFTGASGADSGMFTMYTFDPQNSPFRFLKDRQRTMGGLALEACFDKIPAVPGLRRVKRLLGESYDRWDASRRRRIQQEASRYASHAPPAYIPLALLPHIGVSEDNRPIHLPGALEPESIFDVFSQQGIDYKFLMFPLFNCDDASVTELFLAESKTSAQVVLGQFSDSDLLVHHCGPSSQQRRAVAGEIDRRLREIALHFGDQVTWVIIGDHGMTDVRREVDITAALDELDRRAQVRRGVDYLLFLDSTMARFLFLTDRGRQYATTLRRASVFQEHGKFIDDAIAREYEIPLADRRYGDLIWWADVGTLIFPDYFHDRHTHNKGMHGYDSADDDMKGFFLAMGPAIPHRTFEECQLIDVCASLCAAAGVRPPAGNLGRSLIAA